MPPFSARIKPKTSSTHTPLPKRRGLMPGRTEKNGDSKHVRKNGGFLLQPSGSFNLWDDRHWGSSFGIIITVAFLYMAENNKYVHVHIYIHIIFNNIFNNMVTWGHCPRMEGSEMSRNRIKIWFLDYISYTVQYACVNVLFSAGSSLNSAMVPTFMESAFLRRLITPSLKVQCQWLIARGIKFRNVKRAW